MFRRPVFRLRASSPIRRTKRSFVFENLEDRRLMAVYNWVAPVNGDFSVAANWANSSNGSPGVPGAGDTANIPGNIQVTSSTSRSVNNINGGSLIVAGGTFTLTNVLLDTLIVNLRVESGASLQTLGGTTAIIGCEVFGNIDTGPNGVFRFQRGTLNLNTGTTLTGAGQYLLQGDVFGGPNVSINTNVAAPQNTVVINGVIEGAGTLTINSAFEWRSGTMSGTGQTIVSNTGLLNATLGGIQLSQRTLVNAGTVVFAAIQDNFTINNGGTFVNQAGALFDIRSEFSLGGGSSGVLQNAGTVRRSLGAGSNRLGVQVDNTGTIEVQTGTMALALGTSTNGTFKTTAGATLDMTGNGQYLLVGTSTFQGTGTVLTGGGVLSTSQTSSIWSIPTSVSFVWTGGTLVVPIGGTVSVNGNMTFAASGNAVLRGGGRFRMNGTLNHTGLGNILVTGDLQSNSVATTMEIPASRQYVMRTDGGILNSTPGGILINLGTITKQSGNGTSLINVHLENSGAINVNSGTLALHDTNHLSGVYTVAAAKTLQLNDNGIAQFLASGSLTLAGSGTVAMSTGQFVVGATGGSLSVGATVQFAWTAGEIRVPLNATYSIDGNVSIQSASQVILSGGGTLVLNGTTTHSNVGLLRMQGDGVAAATTLRIPSGKSYLFSGDSGIVNNGGGGGVIDNSGLIVKSTGAGVAQLAVPLLRAANLQVNTGTLQLSISNSVLLGGTWNVAAGAVLDLIGLGSITTVFSGSFSGTGAGQVQLNRGSLAASSDVAGATFNFPNGQLRLLGGTLATNASTITLQGATTFLGASELLVVGSGLLKIVGTFEHQSTANINLVGPTTMQITSTGVLNLRKDSGIVGGVIDNDGVLRKSGGTGLSTVSSRLSNAGTVESRIGTLSVTGLIDEIVGTTLTSGRWNALSTSPNTATLNLNVALTTVGSAASVALSGSGSSFPSLNSLSNLAGSLQLSSGAVLTTTAGLTNTGRLSIGAGSSLNVSANYVQASAGRLTLPLTNGVVGKLRVSGNVSLSGLLTLSSAGSLPAIGTSLTLIENLGAAAVAGTFTGLPQNANVSFGGMTWTIRYNQGPGGNDVTITRTA